MSHVLPVVLQRHRGPEKLAWHTLIGFDGQAFKYGGGVPESLDAPARPV